MLSVYKEKIEDLLASLETDKTNGLTDMQVAKKQEQYGENRLKQKKKVSVVQRFFNQFKDVMILILLAAAAISFVVALMEGHEGAFFEPILILVIVFLNALMGVIQESKAERALEALMELSAVHARVVRNGKEQLVDAVQLVPGDLIKMEAGDFVPADARLLDAASLKVDESALTGESVPVEKDHELEFTEEVPVGDRRNMVYSGCAVTYGTGFSVVTSIGMETQMGSIAGLLESEAEGMTPLQKKLAQLGKYLGIVAIAACAVVFVMGAISGLPLMALFMTAVSLAVSAIPEGLPAIVTIILSIGVQRMVKKNAIIRKLPAVETLGSASIICSDKTGTLTQNKMTLMKAYVDGMDDVENISDHNSDDVRKLLMYATLCSEGSVTIEEEEEVHVGDPTETAIISAALKNDLVKEEVESKYPRVGTLPFDSDRKLMSVIHDIDGKITVIVKGAYDVLAQRTVAGDMDKAELESTNMSRDALRVLGVAYKILEAVPETLDEESLESGLIFFGLVGMIDPPRPEAKEAVKVCRSAGIKPVMITGDHVVTASAIAKELGIFQEEDEAITGLELDGMSDEEFDKHLKHISVYARVSPENKIRIVRAWQRHNKVVAMTGDGVNDAPALKAADIGCAMGITGTEVAKGASDMILTDDNFATIIDAVREGRGIYANIKKVVGFLLGTNVGELFTVFFAMMIWRQTPLLSMQLLWINLVTDSFPAIALGMEKIEDGIMDNSPKPKDEGIFSHGYGIQIGLQGVMFAVLTLAGFYLGIQQTGQIAGGRTMAFIILAMSQVVQSFNMRSTHSLFSIGFFGNRQLNLATGLSAILMAAVVFTPAYIAFGLVKLTGVLYVIALGLSLVPLIVMEVAKAAKLIS